MKIAGGCHCGCLSYEVELPFTEAAIPVRRCRCAFCTKHGAVYTSHPAGRLRAQTRGDQRATTYAFATRTAEFHVCAVCGVVPFVTCEIDSALWAVVNVNTFEAVDPALFVESVGDFAGEDLERRLARRQRTWIPDVVTS